MINRGDIKGILFNDLIIDSMAGVQLKEGWKEEAINIERKLQDVFSYMQNAEDSDCVLKLEKDRIKKIIISVKLYGSRTRNVLEIELIKEESKEIYETLEGMLDTICEATSSMVKVASIIEYINQRSSKETEEKDRKILIEYTWGYGNYSKIIKWSQTKINIALNKSAVNWLAEANESDIDELMHDEYYNKGFNGIIIDFEQCLFHSKSGAKLETKVISEELTRNMLYLTDIINIIKSNKGMTGTQNIKFSTIFYGLGTLIAIGNCVVDYDSSKIKSELIDVYDVENEAFTRGDIFNRVQRVLKINSDTITL